MSIYLKGSWTWTVMANWGWPEFSALIQPLSERMLYCCYSSDCLSCVVASVCGSEGRGNVKPHWTQAASWLNTVQWADCNIWGTVPLGLYLHTYCYVSSNSEQQNCRSNHQRSLECKGEGWLLPKCSRKVIQHHSKHHKWHAGKITAKVNYVSSLIHSPQKLLLMCPWVRHLTDRMMEDFGQKLSILLSGEFPAVMCVIEYWRQC